MFNPAQQFYPTPALIAQKMWRTVKTSTSYRKNGLTDILDPQAGSGSLLEALSIAHERNRDRYKLYAIEIDPDLRAILKDKGFMVIGTDFLEYQEPVQFDIILSNPPFNRDAEHILKSWNMVRPGGVLCALCNSETIRNPDKKWGRLNDLIDQYGTVEALGQCFKEADRKTNVEVSLIFLEKPKRVVNPEEFQFSGKFQSSNWSEKAEEFAANPLAHLDVIDNLLIQYNRCLSVLQTRHQVQTELDYHISSIPFMEFDLGDKLSLSGPSDTFDQQVWKLKKRFWGAVFKMSRMADISTSHFSAMYIDFVKTQQGMEFCKANILEILAAFFTNREQIMIDSLVKMFDQATGFHADNKIHHEGWKTNSGWKLNKRFIIPYGMPWDKRYGWWDSPSRGTDRYRFFHDLDVISCWVAGEDAKDPNYKTLLDLMGIYSKATQIEPGTWYELKFFKIKFFKKGTIWVEFIDQYLLDDINLIAARSKKWLGNG